MDDEQKEIAKIGAEAAMKPFTELFQKLFGGPSEEIGGMWQDALQVRRFGRRLKLLKRVQALIDKAGFTPKQVSDKLGIPLLNASSLEDDDTLQEKWANLLVNAAHPTPNLEVQPTFVTILAELTPSQAFLLDALYRDATKKAERKSLIEDVQYSIFDLKLLHEPPTVPPGQYVIAVTNDFAVMVEVLKRLGLVVEAQDQKASPAATRGLLGASKFSLSHLGSAFIKACQPPIRA